MKVNRITYKGYREFLEARKKGHKIPQIFGKYQYLFSNSKGEISLIKYIRTYNKSPNFWEIYCLKGNLFGDCERYKTKKKAIEVIKKYLEVDDLSELVSKKLEKIRNEKKKDLN